MIMMRVRSVRVQKISIVSPNVNLSRVSNGASRPSRCGALSSAPPRWGSAESAAQPKGRGGGSGKGHPLPLQSEILWSRKSTDGST